MKRIRTEIKEYSKLFFKHWLKFLSLFIGMDLINQWLVIPFFRWVTTYVLQEGEIPFISYQNLLLILTQHPFVVLMLLIELIALMIIIYGQFAFIMIAVKDISEPWREIFKKSWAALKHLNFGSILVLTGYFILIVPFAGLIFTTPLLAKIKIPEFIVDYMMRSASLLAILLVFFLVIIVVGVRWIYTLPLMVFKGEKTRAAIKESVQLTKNKRWWKILSTVIVAGAISALAVIIGNLLILLSQLLWDEMHHVVALVFANVNLLLIQLLSQLFSAWTVVVSLRVILKPIVQENTVEKSTIKNYGLMNKIIAGVVFVLAIISTIANNQVYLQPANFKLATISHRGVSEENGVQNTIPALKRTAKLKPDYVEIDLHETKDNQFIVLHDENLKELAGKNVKPKQLTLKQLTNITVSENGYKAKLASFDQYLKAAQKLNQKLLIEVKTTPHDSKGMLKRFNKKYGKMILKRHYQVQSLDYSVIRDLNRINPRLYLIYIQPYNFTYPQSEAKGYSMEYSTLTQDFIYEAHLNNAIVYAWTVNESSVMKKLMYEKVNGIITDDLKSLNEEIEDFNEDRSYSNLLFNYVIAWV